MCVNIDRQLGAPLSIWHNIYMAEAGTEGYIKIRLNSLFAGEAIPFDLYVMIGAKLVHYLRAGDQLTPEKLAKFEDKAPDSFYIKEENRTLYKTNVSGNLRSDKLDPQQKAIILRESSLSLVEELFESPDVKRALDESKEIIDEFVTLMGDEPDAMAHLIGLSSHDFYTYTHSLDVGIYSLGLAQAAGFSGDELKEMGQGALFHDIGKRQVDVDIICKDGPLDDIEWAQMQKHPEFGLQILNDYDVSDAIKACCYEHHESEAGNGYPQQLEADEIHPMAKIVALTDTFDALTTQRSYNKPMTPKGALDFIKTKLSKRYDPDLLKAMYEILFKMEKTLQGS